MPDRRTRLPKFLQYVDGQRKPKKLVDEVYRVFVGDKRFRFRFHGPSGGYLLIDQREALRVTKDRLAEINAHLRAIPDAKTTKEEVSKQKIFFEEYAKPFSGKLSIVESEFALILTDFPAQAGRGVAAYVDQLCKQLNAIVAIPDSANIWNGKVMIALFSDQKLFADFESKKMENPNFGKSAAIFHPTTDKFVVACFGKLDKTLARTICWGVAGGYVSRYRSNAPLPAWVRVGTREWVTNVVFPDRARYSKHTKEVATELRKLQSLSGILSAKEFNTARNALAWFLVDYLATKSPQAYGQFFRDLKGGHDWEKALLSNYGMKPDQFAKEFGRRFGTPNVVTQ